MSMPKIKIVDVPPGQAPDWVRKAWVGLEMPLSNVQPDHIGILIGVVDKKPEDANAGGYVVSGRVAIETLERKNTEAANWWRENAPWILGNQLVFDKKVCQIVAVDLT